jgi:hypothetical protein
VAEIRFANGQELIRFNNGGRYTLVAPRPGVRGYSVDTVFVDEVREQRSFDLMAALRPTLTASKNPQIIHLSNAGDDQSVVLNELQRRGLKGEGSIAYLEWSASPERPIGDEAGWVEANPALGHTIQLETLRDLLMSSTPAEFETEHLCRWVVTMQPTVISQEKWIKARGQLETPKRPALGVSMDADSRRASAVLAWRQADRRIAVRVIADVTGDPIDVDRLGDDLRPIALRFGVTEVGFDNLTDGEFARHFKNAKSMTGRAFANACSTFVAAVEAGLIVWDEADAVGADLVFTARKALGEGAWVAVKARDDRPITAVLAAIRAVQLASGPLVGAPRVM